MAKYNYLSKSPEDTSRFAREVGQLTQLGSVIGLQGPIGAGKTLFSKGFALGIGLQEEITSPTYPIILEYPLSHGFFVHMDWYRTSGTEEIELLGIEEFFHSRHICLIEWADKATELLPSHAIHVSFEILNPTERNISMAISDELYKSFSLVLKESGFHES